MVEIYYIRHSQTYYNAQKSWLQNQPDHPVEFRKHFLFLNDPQFIDAELTDIGIKTSLKARELNSNITSKVRFVVTSPLIRAVKSVDLIFSNENVNMRPKVFIHPFLMSKLSSIYSLSFRVLDRLAEFPNFDFSMIEGSDKQVKLDWIIDKAVREEHRGPVRQLLSESDSASNLEKALTVVKYMQSIYPDAIETRKDKFYKLQEFKRWLAQFIIDNDVKDGELAVLCHQLVLKSLVATKFDDNFKPSDTYKFANTELCCRKFEPRDYLPNLN